MSSQLHIEPIFRNRVHAGEALAKLVAHALVAQSLPGQAPPTPGVLVLGLARGGVPVAFEVARALHAELDIFLVRKLGMPGQRELAIGAIASGGVRVLNESLIAELHLPAALIEQVAAREERELKHREQLYRRGRPPTPVCGRTVVVVDDGLATGASMRAAVRALRLQAPKRIVVAVPVAARESCAELQMLADQVVCAHTPDPFIAVGIWYADFPQTTDQEVQRLLQQAAPHPQEHPDAAGQERLP